MKKKSQFTVHEHIVPECYLELFLNSKNQKVHRYHKQNGDIKFVSTSGVAYEDDFYEIYTVNDGKKEYVQRNVLEDALGEMENRFIQSWSEIIYSKNMNKISDKEMQILCDFVSIQFARTKRQYFIMRDVLETLIPNINSFSCASQKLAIQNTLFAYKKDKTIKDDVSLRDMVYEWLINYGCFIFLENNKPHQFYTCDNPVLIFNETDNLILEALYIPLSPSFALWVVDKRQFPYLYKINKNYINEDGIQFFNKLICDNADKYIIANEFSEEDISFLKLNGYNVTHIKY